MKALPFQTPPAMPAATLRWLELGQGLYTTGFDFVRVIRKALALTDLSTALPSMLPQFTVNLEQALDQLHQAIERLDHRCHCALVGNSKEALDPRQWLETRRVLSQTSDSGLTNQLQATTVIAQLSKAFDQFVHACMDTLGLAKSLFSLVYLELDASLRQLPMHALRTLLFALKLATVELRVVWEQLTLSLNELGLLSAPPTPSETQTAPSQATTVLKSASRLPHALQLAFHSPDSNAIAAAPSPDTSTSQPLLTAPNHRLQSKTSDPTLLSTPGKPSTGSQLQAHSTDQSPVVLARLASAPTTPKGTSGGHHELPGQKLAHSAQDLTVLATQVLAYFESYMANGRDSSPLFAAKGMASGSSARLHCFLAYSPDTHTGRSLVIHSPSARRLSHQHPVGSLGSPNWPQRTLHHRHRSETTAALSPRGQDCHFRTSSSDIRRLPSSRRFRLEPHASPPNLAGPPTPPVFAGPFQGIPVDSPRAKQSSSAGAFYSSPEFQSTTSSSSLSYASGTEIESHPLIPKLAHLAACNRRLQQCLQDVTGLAPHPPRDSDLVNRPLRARSLLLDLGTSTDPQSTAQASPPLSGQVLTFTPGFSHRRSHTASSVPEHMHLAAKSLSTPSLRPPPNVARRQLVSAASEFVKAVVALALVVKQLIMLESPSPTTDTSQSSSTDSHSCDPAESTDGSPAPSLLEGPICSLIRQLVVGIQPLTMLIKQLA
ncbi:hypothetical protein H4R34_005415 [Dimargaris verticillata]|uniref:Uncharacterized protein n=1 Tax=Dimargaris verticillata TaxID=2761393 RepID=A0A9W8EB95_9FUNG|nr:hypothetical protein H4R34_005415 [Dimargaris verticillata]